MKGLFGLIHNSCNRFPGKTFVQGTERSWTYSEVDALANRTAAYIASYGVKKGDRVIIICDNSIQYIAAFFGTLGANAVAVPVNPARMTENILYIIEKCSPGLIIYCNSTAKILDRIGQRLSVKAVNIDSYGLWEGQEPDGGDNVKAEPDVDENDAAVILFTSGTTTSPKGVTLTHRNLMSNTEATLEYLQLTPDDSMLMTLPFMYSYGNSVLLTHTLAGASLIIENSTTYPCKILDDIKYYKVSGFSTVGSYMNLMLKYIKSLGTNDNFFVNLRYVTFAGEAVYNDDIRFLCANYPGMKVYVMYGQTEASPRLSYLSPEFLPDKTGSIGKGLHNVELRVIDEAGADVMPGEIGEIIARGPNIMKCYWEDPGATEEVLKDGWLYTGDLAAVDEEGFIYIKGRKSDILKHMGHRISPLEIENVINSFSSVKESAVVESMLNGVPAIKAFIVMDIECTIDEVKRYVNSKLPVFMRPQIFEIAAELPRTDTGKIRRNALRRS